MFEIGMAVLAAFVGGLIGVLVHYQLEEPKGRILWAVVDLLWVLALIFTVAFQTSELNRRIDHADTVAEGQALGWERESIRLLAFIGERKTCPYMAGARAPTQSQPLCNALSEAEFEASRSGFAALDAQRVEKQLAAADSSNLQRNLRRELTSYAARSAKITGSVISMTTAWCDRQAIASPW